MTFDGRSYEVIEDADLARLARLARRDREQFFERRPEYRDRLLCVALCQGAGLHYVDQALGSKYLNGVKDFDVWTFFADVPGQRFPADRRNTHQDFGVSRFGRWDGEGPRFEHYEGRRVDLLMRALPVSPEANPIEAVRAWLAEAKTESARLLAAKGVVLIKPNKYRGRVIWPLRLALVPSP
jgi:hypothetical protein